MPLAVISAADAVKTRKENAFTRWGQRGSENRVEPIAKPWIDAPFKIRPGEKIFTVGSCFARNVERELLRLGFRVPVRDIFRRPEFEGLEFRILDNFGTPSIYNEIAWAFGEETFDPKDNILEIRPGLFADAHLYPTLRPVPLEIALARRQAIAEAYRTVTDCSLVIMTLGLVELWFDKRTGIYLNVSPRPSMMEKEPDRYELHVLSFEETYSYLDKAILILKRHVPNLRVMITVSPIPLGMTHRHMDVIVANTYSKSVLRTAAETLVTKYDFTTYYPSYESVILSDRKMAWTDDLVHATSEIVALNVRRMIEAFVEGAEIEELDRNDPIASIEAARRARERGLEVARRFFEKYGDISEKSAEFALEYSQYLLADRQADAALSLMQKFDPQIVEIAVVTARALVALNRPAEAYELMNAHCADAARVGSHAAWDMLLNAAIATRSADLIDSALIRMKDAMPNRIAPYAVKAANAHIADARRDRAISAAVLALDTVGNDNPRNSLELAQILIALGEFERAYTVLDSIVPENDIQRERAERLRLQITKPARVA